MEEIGIVDDLAKQSVDPVRNQLLRIWLTLQLINPGNDESFICAKFRLHGQRNSGFRVR